MVPVASRAPSRSSSPEAKRAPAWSRTMQLGLAFLLGVLVLFLVQQAWSRLGKRPRPTTGERAVAGYRVDLNQAERGELQQLPGVGPGLAERIVDYRQTHGPFASVDELEDVPGIGAVIVERLRPCVYVSNQSEQPAPPKGDRPYARKQLPARPIDLNRANRDELMQLPGVGPVLADRIIADRNERGPYGQVSDVTRVKGIKGKTLEKILPYAYVEGPRPAVARRDGT